MSLILASIYVKKILKVNNVKVVKINCIRKTLHPKFFHNHDAKISNDYHKTEEVRDEFWIRGYGC
jgi:hypothetical protein